MTHPREWTVVTYFIIGLLLGAIAAYGLLLACEPVRWIQVLIAVALPSITGLLAVLFRDHIFWFL